MKEKLFTTISTLMILIPWTLLPIRSFEWALESPTAEILISCYAAFMIFSGIFTILCYTKAGIRHTWMKICVLINGVYAVGGITAFGLMIPNLLQS